jgi:hypothetical protein
MRRASDGRVNLPHSQPIWVMEVRTTCKTCSGTGRPLVRVQATGGWVIDPDDPDGVCTNCNGQRKAWYGVHPGNGDVYTYLTRSDAARMLNTCYPDACRNRRLGDDEEAAGVRVTECKLVNEQLVRVYDGSKV